MFADELSKFCNVIQDGNVMYCGTSAMDQNKFYRGRKFGGTAILWKSNLASVDVINTVSNRLSCVKYNISENFCIFIFCIYMPCDDGYISDNFIEYQDVLGEISVICQQVNAQFICLAGDFNTDFIRNTPHTNELKEFCMVENLKPLLFTDIRSKLYI